MKFSPRGDAVNKLIVITLCTSLQPCASEIITCRLNFIALNNLKIKLAILFVEKKNLIKKASIHL